MSKVIPLQSQHKSLDFLKIDNKGFWSFSASKGCPYTNSGNLLLLRASRSKELQFSSAGVVAHIAANFSNSFIQRWFLNQIYLSQPTFLLRVKDHKIVWTSGNVFLRLTTIRLYHPEHFLLPQYHQWHGYIVYTAWQASKSITIRESIKCESS